MTMPRPFRHSWPFHAQPGGHTGSAPASARGPSGHAAGSGVAVPHAEESAASDAITTVMKGRFMASLSRRFVIPYHRQSNNGARGASKSIEPRAGLGDKGS